MANETVRKKAEESLRNKYSNCRVTRFESTGRIQVTVDTDNTEDSCLTVYSRHAPDGYKLQNATLHRNGRMNVFYTPTE